MKMIEATEAPAAIGPYSHAIDLGDLVFCSGQTPLDPTTMELVGGDIETQTRQVLHNLDTVLQAMDLGLSNIVKTTVFLKSQGDARAGGGSVKYLALAS